MKRVLLLLLLSFSITLVKANNVQITGVTTTVTNGVTILGFDIQWDNSWRGGPGNNYDAVWVFIKYKDERQFYTHLDMLDTLNTAAGGLKLEVSKDHKGCFIYRSTNGLGNIASTHVSLGIQSKSGTYDLKVFGIEMVYIPTGPFYLGHSGGNSSNFGAAGTSGATPFQITSQYPPYIGAGTGYLYDSRVAGSVGFNYNWPTGYNAFYIMKYELSQAGYRDFLNAIPTYSNYALPERSDLTGGSGGNYATVGTRLFPAGYRNNLVVSAAFGTDVIGANADGNTTYNEATDGEWTAANFLYWSDAAAFLDWAALRPMTEFEYEKAANGPEAINYPQFATGSYYQVNTSTPVLNPFTATETITKATGVQNNINTSETLVNGPMRSGFAADATSNRLTAGASYYGVLDMSGNVWEPVVTAANAAGRSFDGTLGDGSVGGLSGRANQSTWPGVQNDPTQANAAGEVQKLYTAGISKKGGGFDQNLYNAISDVNYDPAVASEVYPTTRINARAFGCRGVRQADQP